MPSSVSLSLYHRHRFPAEIISHSVWLYFRFALSFRDVEEMLAMRGVFSHIRDRPRMVPQVRPDFHVSGKEGVSIAGPRSLI